MPHIKTMPGKPYDYHVECPDYDMPTDTYGIVVSRVYESGGTEHVCRVQITFPRESVMRVEVLSHRDESVFFNPMEVLGICHDQIQDAMMEAIGERPYTQNPEGWNHG